ncbi:MAG: alpha/beta fold hydrolase [Pseudomonadota bacterium]
MTEFTIDTGSGSVSATLDVPEHPKAALLLAHGAGADHRHAHMNSLAQMFCTAGLATLRFNFPFKEAGRNRVDTKDISTATIVDAAADLTARFDLPLLIGGHSFGGRMATHAVAEDLVQCTGMVLCSFPLHPAGKPSTQRAEHLPKVEAPMLFLNGTRDGLAERALLNGVVADLSDQHRVHWLDTADHSFKVLKRSRQSTLSVYEEAGEVVRAFFAELNIG